MEKLFERANTYISTCDWKDLALVKFCLCAIGVLIGLSIPDKHKKTAASASAGIFGVTYLLLMADFLPTLFRKEE